MKLKEKLQPYEVAEKPKPNKTIEYKTTVTCKTTDCISNSGNDVCKLKEIEVNWNGMCAMFKSEEYYERS